MRNFIAEFRVYAQSFSGINLAVAEFNFSPVCVCVCVFVCERDTRRGRETGRLEAWETVCFGLLMCAFMVEFY